LLVLLFRVVSCSFFFHFFQPPFLLSVTKSTNLSSLSDSGAYCYAPTNSLSLTSHSCLMSPPNLSKTGRSALAPNHSDVTPLSCLAVSFSANPVSLTLLRSGFPLHSLSKSMLSVNFTRVSFPLPISYPGLRGQHTYFFIFLLFLPIPSLFLVFPGLYGSLFPSLGGPGQGSGAHEGVFLHRPSYFPLSMPFSKSRCRPRILLLTRPVGVTPFCRRSRFLRPLP